MIKPLPLSASARQTALARSLYRKLYRECQRIPPNASLVHLDQWIGDTQIKDKETLRSCLRSTFRPSGDNTHLTFSNKEQKYRASIVNGENAGEKEGIQRALDGLKYLLTLDLTELSEPQTDANKTGTTTFINNKIQRSFYSLDPPIRSESMLGSVEWLPPVSEMNEIPSDCVELPIFPLSGPLFADDEGQKLPLISQFSETLIVGSECSLKIFEPRYRKMYQDLLSSADTSARRFIVPFPHPYQQRSFASYGWIYEIVRVRDVADDTNGKYQLLCNHKVTQPVKILGFANPEDYETQSHYLRCFAKVLPEGALDPKNDTNEEPQEYLDTQESQNSEDLRSLEELLRQLENKPLSLSSDNTNRQIDECLIPRLQMALGEGSIWSVAQVWILNMQTEILQLQLKISTRIQLQAKLAQELSPTKNNTANWQEFVTDEMVALAQEPYKNHLKSMLIEVSTLIPWLLQEDSHKARCDQMCERIRERLVVDETEEERAA